MKPFRLFLLYCYGLALAAGTARLSAADSARLPNIVFILADDLGYGSLGCHGATKIKTPNVDRMAHDGIKFTAAHSPASVCSPSRYNFLTGRYAWREVPEANRHAQWEQWHQVATMPADAYYGHVAVEANEPLWPQPGRPTLASFLQAAGYTTACVGKWHLGFGRAGMPGWDDKLGPDWNRELSPGPLDVGFDYFFGLPVVNSSEPKVFVENRHVLGLDPADPMCLLLAYNKAGRLEYKSAGGASAHFPQDVIDARHTEKAVEWIRRAAAGDKPFFLYFPLSSPHYPFVPGPRYKGTSQLGARGDAIEEMDGCVGDVLAALERLKIADRTLVFFASDNGAQSSATKRFDHAVFQGLELNGPLRGQKTEIYEAAHRVPLVALWPGHIKPGTVSDELVALTDVFATCADLLGQPLPHDGGEDSFSFLDTLLGRGRSRRESLVTDSMTGVLALQRGPWKYIAGRGHGGNYPAGGDDGAPDPASPPGQLYNLSEDVSEHHDVYATHPEIVTRLSHELERLVAAGRSHP
jgi:arylsulfatase A-like enzyme